MDVNDAAIMVGFPDLLTVQFKFYLIFYQQACTQPPLPLEIQAGHTNQIFELWGYYEPITESFIQDCRYECSRQESVDDRGQVVLI